MTNEISQGGDTICPIQQDDLGWVLALNTRHQVELSLLTRQRLGELVKAAFLAVCVPKVAFLVAFDETGDYDSPNFLWFRGRYERFVYVDRVAVSDAARGRGMARLLYEALFAQARKTGSPLIACEVNSQPPNPASDAFHLRFGFKQIGSAQLDGAGKEVRYLLKAL